MMITGHMNYFSINECGLYKHQDAKIYGLDVKECFDRIGAWLATTSLSDTLPWNEKFRKGSNCYCNDIFISEETGDVVLVLWKSEAGGNGTIYGAQEDAITGSGKVVEYTANHKGSKVIWGRPCYYWIIPSLNLVVSIKFEHSVTDSQLFQDWVREAITNKVKHPNKLKETTPGGQIRLSFTDGTQSSEQRYRFGFDVSLKTMNTADGKLDELAQKITHVIRRETISFSTADDSAEWVRVFNKTLPFLKTQPKSTTRQIEVRAEARPTPEQLKRIVEEYAKDNRKPSEWDNVGFSTNEKTTVWVDRYRLKHDINFDQKEKGAISAVKLYEQLLQRRDYYLEPAIDPIKSENNINQKTGT
ncbi:hypothetical protein [Paraburkholderia tropica]|uniref:Uncharacterized protein n=1 Tax=Paraburkholderia tropica TaxID=92647 RepID=A0AAQ1GH56_9BURK|nr:hypothetical protein [Paraburkholderia tropica]RQN38546.1 hypothetical protein EHZ25_12355 [Paraburkholderia tropica]SEJ88453.1 hypothetical protein SAMN05216550_1102 [Paraburkholderia tropica]